MRSATILVIVLVAAATSLAHASCIEGDSQPNPADCGSFYVCAGGRLLLRPCPAPLHYNAALGVCDHPAAAGCQQQGPQNDCPATGGGVLLPHPQCGLFYACDYGTPHERRCAGGLHFNAATNQCDWPQVANCKPDEAPEQAGAVLLPGAATTTTTTRYPPTKRPTTTTRQPEQTTEQPEWTPRPTEPATTQRPTTQRPTTQRPTTQRPATTTEEQSTTDNVTTVEPVRPGTIIPELLIGNECAEDNDLEYEFLPHPQCQMFYICVVGQPRELTCPDGFHYSVAVQHCVLEEFADCVEGAAPWQE